MCFDLDSAPPIPRDRRRVRLARRSRCSTAADGNRFAAFLATPDEPATAGVVIYPDVRGLYHFYEELALRFAERGYAAIAFDYFGRTAGVEKRDDDFEYMPHVEQTTDDGVQADARAAVERLRGLGRTLGLHASASASAAATSWIAAASGHGLARRGRLLRLADARARRRRARSRASTEMECADPRAAGGRRRRTSPPRTTPRSTRRSTDAGVEHEIVTYDGAPHSFFDRKQEEFRTRPTTRGAGRSRSSTEHS